MKLWKRRPLSVDLTQSNQTVINEMPPSLVYISPSNHNVSRRCSFISNEILSKPHYFSDLTSVNSTEKCHLQSFTNSTLVSFEDGTIRSTRLSNKSYLSPVSAEWLPVKDVMKIKRSASVPFHSPQYQPIITTNFKTIETSTQPVKTHVSLADKLRTLFRTRSTSRSTSKTALTPIVESTKSNKSKVRLRSSRTRTKEIEACKSMYESSSRVQDHVFSERLSHALRDCATRTGDSSQQQKMESFQQIDKKKEKPPKNNKKKTKEPNTRLDTCKTVLPKGFSESVVSHTASSAAKCKPSPPKSVLKSTFNCRFNDQQTAAINTSSNKYELPLSGEALQPITGSICDKTICEVNDNKSDSPTGVTASGTVDNNSAILQTRGESVVLANKSVTSMCHFSGDRPSNSDVKSSNDRPEEDDYVTLAEVDLSFSPGYSCMTQSIHGPIMRELAKSNHEYENIDLRDFQSNNNKPKSQSTKPPQCSLMKTAPGQHKRRPISCIAIVDGDNNGKLHHHHQHRNHNNNTNGISSRCLSREPPQIINPKSPYLSQYTKLYSLKATNGEIMYTHQPEPHDSDLMTRSQTSYQYKSPSVLGKETSGKRSIDSGLVDDLSMNFHDSAIIQT